MTKKTKRPRGVLVAAYVPKGLRREAQKVGRRRVWSLSQVLRHALARFVELEKRRAA